MWYGNGDSKMELKWRGSEKNLERKRKKKLKNMVCKKKNNRIAGCHMGIGK